MISVKNTFIFSGMFVLEEGIQTRKLHSREPVGGARVCVCAWGGGGGEFDLNIIASFGGGVEINFFLSKEGGRGHNLI